MNRIAAALALSSALVATPAFAQPPPPPPPAPPVDPTAHRHLGFALRLDGGIGYTGASASDIDASIKGVSGSFGLVVGAAVTENFIIGGDVWDTVVFSPTFSQGGISVSGTDTSMALVGFGLNLTYYFMPANVYLSASPSLTTLNLSGSGTTGSTETGFGMKIGLGKEWWVADHWGLGLAGQFFFSTNKDKGTNPPTWSTLAGGLAFSATYN
jgi:hypothetical protein